MLKRNRKATAELPAPPKPVAVDQKTVIGDQISIEGAIRGKEDLLIEGSVKGSIEVKAHHLTVGIKGQVEAEILAGGCRVTLTLQAELR